MRLSAIPPNLLNPKFGTVFQLQLTHGGISTPPGDLLDMQQLGITRILNNTPRQPLRKRKRWQSFYDSVNWFFSQTRFSSPGEATIREKLANLDPDYRQQPIVRLIPNDGFSTPSAPEEPLFPKIPPDAMLMVTGPAAAKLDTMPDDTDKDVNNRKQTIRDAGPVHPEPLKIQTVFYISEGMALDELKLDPLEVPDFMGIKDIDFVTDASKA